MIVVFLRGFPQQKNTNVTFCEQTHSSSPCPSPEPTSIRPMALNFGGFWSFFHGPSNCHDITSNIMRKSPDFQRTYSLTLHVELVEAQTFFSQRQWERARKVSGKSVWVTLWCNIWSFFVGKKKISVSGHMENGVRGVFLSDITPFLYLLRAMQNVPCSHTFLSSLTLVYWA